MSKCGVAFLVLLGCAMAGTAAAQPRTPWWKDGESKAELRLTDDQSARIEAIFRESWERMKSSYEELGRREGQLSTLVNGPDTTEADVVRQVEQVESVRGELNKVRTVMLYRMHRVLTQDQRVKLDEMRKARDRERERDHPRRVPELQ